MAAGHQISVFARDVRTALGNTIAMFMLVFGAAAYAEFEPEKIGIGNQLPEAIPDHWVLVRDFGALGLSIEGRVLVVDPLGEHIGDQFKGMITASFAAALEFSARRNEIYVAETFWSRGGRGGEQTDVVTIWDPQTLSVIDEVLIPRGRLVGFPKRNVSGLIGGDRFLGIYNFTPAQTVSIVDLEKRIFVGEIPIAGCGLVVPTGVRSFTSICANGSFRTTHLQADGRLGGVSTTEVLFDPQESPVFEMPLMANGTAYFVSYDSHVLPVDIRGERISAGARWPLAQEASEAGWRPGGINTHVHDTAGLGYVLMHPEGGEGTHNNGGSEVWVYDLGSKKRLSRIALQTWGVTLGVSGSGDQRLLHVTNLDRKIDVYRIPSGEHVRTLDVGASAPQMFQGLQK
jgi:methylamine dehydrogenase heavy chain